MSITRTGNGHAGRLLVEAAWHQRKTYRNPGHTMRTHRWGTLTARRRKPVIANVAVASELAGWAWSLAGME